VIKFDFEVCPDRCTVSQKRDP